MSFENYIEQEANISGYILNQGQRTAIKALSELAYNYWYKAKNIYIYGDVGRGKSYVLNYYYSYIGLRNKLKLHFYEFMYMLRKYLIKDSMETVILKLMKYDLICLDEFHVTDIGTASIISRVMLGLNNKTILVFTSNYKISDLYSDGINRSAFMSTIDLIARSSIEIAINHNEDYRSLANSGSIIFTKEALLLEFGVQEVAKVYIINEVELSCFGYISNKLLAIDFISLCSAKLSQDDFRQLSNISILMLLNPRNILAEEYNIARRLTFLLDAYYEASNIICVESAINFEDIYRSGALANEFSRSVSRFKQLNSISYFKNHKYYNNIKKLIHADTKV